MSKTVYVVVSIQNKLKTAMNFSLAQGMKVNTFGIEFPLKLDLYLLK